MNIRELTTDERAAAIGLWAEAGLTRPWNDPGADFDRALAAPRSAVLGGSDGGLLLGTVMVGDDGHRGWVYYLAVRDPHRHRGVGRQLMAAAEGWLRGHGVGKVNLMVRSSNQVALGFYARLGYQDDEVAVLSRWLSESS
jgi:ribosomal protein S18 acetylase RimI-like enzyme